MTKPDDIYTIEQLEQQYNKDEHEIELQVVLDSTQYAEASATDKLKMLQYANEFKYTDDDKKQVEEGLQKVMDSPRYHKASAAEKLEMLEYKRRFVPFRMPNTIFMSMKFLRPSLLDIFKEEKND